MRTRELELRRRISVEDSQRILDGVRLTGGFSRLR